MVRCEGLKNVEICRCRVGMLYQCTILLVMVLSILLERIVCLPFN